jgi:hypothetical protein
MCVSHLTLRRDRRLDRQLLALGRSRHLFAALQMIRFSLAFWKNGFLPSLPLEVHGT